MALQELPTFLIPRPKYFIVTLSQDAMRTLNRVVVSKMNLAFRPEHSRPLAKIGLTMNCVQPESLYKGEIV